MKLLWVLVFLGAIFFGPSLIELAYKKTNIPFSSSKFDAEIWKMTTPSVGTTKCARGSMVIDLIQKIESNGWRRKYIVDMLGAYAHLNKQVNIDNQHWVPIEDCVLFDLLYGGSGKYLILEFDSINDNAKLTNWHIREG